MPLAARKETIQSSMNNRRMSYITENSGTKQDAETVDQQSSKLSKYCLFLSLLVFIPIQYTIPILGMLFCLGCFSWWYNFIGGI